VLANITKFTANQVTAITFANDAAVQSAATAVADDAIAADSITLTNGAISTSQAAVLANITKFTANQVTAISLTDTEFKTLADGTNLGPLNTASVTLDASGATSGELTSLNTNIAKVVDDGITGTFSATVTQAATVGLGVKVDASAIVSITGFTTNGAQSIETGVFQSGSDRLVLSDAVFTLAGTDGDTTLGSDFSSTTTAAMAGGAIGTATDAELIVFDATTGVLYYNSDGAVAGGFTAITTIGVNTLAATDFDIVA
jgi:hypothetical protein